MKITDVLWGKKACFLLKFKTIAKAPNNVIFGAGHFRLQSNVFLVFVFGCLYIYMDFIQ